jgi:hypothetical protein
MTLVSTASRAIGSQVPEVDNRVLAGVSGAWASAQVTNAMVAAAAALAPSKFAGYPADASQVLKGDASWGAITTGQITGAPASNRKGLKGTGDWSSDPQSIQTLGRGFLVETYDNGLSDNLTALASGALLGSVIGVPAGTTLASATTFVGTGSAAATHFWFILYDATLARVRVTADTPLAVNVSNAFVTLNFTSAVTPSTDTVYYLALLITGVATVTVPQKLVTTGQLAGPNGANAWRAFTQTGLAAVPDPVVPAFTSSNRWLAAA